MSDQDVTLLLELVERMRSAQKAYYRSKGDPEALNIAKTLERDVDAAIKQIKAGPPKPDLFSGG